MRNLTLNGLLGQFTADAGTRLNLAAATDDIPFDVVETGDRGPLYCYRPLTGEFIRQRLGLLTALASYAPAARALAGVGGGETYLRARGEHLIPDSERERADAALHCFLARVFEERSEFSFDRDRFELAYEELERAIFEGRCVTEIVASLQGVDLDRDTDELPLGEGLSIVRAAAMAGAPPDLAGGWDPGTESLLLVLRVAHERDDAPSPTYARARFARVLTALRLYESGHYSLGQLGYTRVDGGVWRALAIGRGGRPRRLTLIARDSEDEFRGFCNLIARRLVALRSGGSWSGEVGWALTRFELGCEREAPLEALTDHLLALRALLEPEGPSTARLAQRLSVICAAPEERARLAERAARAIALERAVISGLAPEVADAERVIDELTEHLRSILRDVICGHLDADVRALADDLLAEAAEEIAV